MSHSKHVMSINVLNNRDEFGKIHVQTRNIAIPTHVSCLIIIIIIIARTIRTTTTTSNTGNIPYNNNEKMSFPVDGDHLYFMKSFHLSHVPR